MSTEYQEIAPDKIPTGVRFIVPQSNQGQIIEVAYGAFGAGEPGPDDPFKRVTDRSIPPGQPGRVKFFKRT